MVDLGHQSGSNERAPKVNSRYEASLDDTGAHIKRVRESKEPFFIAESEPIGVDDWTRVMSQNFRVLSVPKNLKLKIACMFLKGAPAMWFDAACLPHLYRWNKFRSSIERNFGSLGVDWERRMVKEFGNSTDDSSDGRFGHDEGVGPSNVPVRSARNDDSSDSGDNDDDYEEEPEDDLEEESDGDKTQENGVIHGG